MSERYIMEDAMPCDITIDLAISRQPERLYRSLHLSHIHFLPLVELNAHGQPSASSLTGDAWGRFLNTVFDIWVREDVGRVSVSLFETTLNIWRGLQPGSIPPETLCTRCRHCEHRRFCAGCGISQDRSILCSGYHQFFAYTAPYMRVMRDLLNQHRSPMELMALLG
ncbi:radical SAM protein [Superficieibacter sp.]|uniref:radical SAM protein n=1 Tax=Superficieibacter sp. TaxID=2303322 RepID=UPI0028A60A5A|nr:radical SAM protein [Superficieibacter sp.]